VERLPELPVNRDFESGSVKEALQLSVPEEPLGHDELVARLRELAFEQSMYPGHPSFLAYISGSGTVPGAAALVSHGEDVEIAGVGEVEPQSIVRIASITKPITAAGRHAPRGRGTRGAR